MPLSGIQVSVVPLNKKEKISFGVDMGGSHFSVYAVNEKGETIGKSEWTGNFDDKTQKEKKEEAVLNKLTELIGECNSQIDHEQYEVVSVGFGVPGTFKGTKILDLTNVGLKYFDLGKELKERFTEIGLDSKVTIEIVNDGTAATYAEMYHENGAFYDEEEKTGVVLGIGTGIAYESIKDGIVPGAEESSEYPHHPFKFGGGKKCGCGLFDCWEIYASSRELRRDISKILGLKVSDDKKEDQTLDGYEAKAVLFKARGLDIPIDSIEKLKERNLNLLDILDDEKTMKILEKHKEWKAILIAGLPGIINDKRDSGRKIILGGAGNFFLTDEDMQEINDRVNKLPLKIKGKCEIVKSKMPTNAGGIGAAMIALHKERQQEKLIQKAMEFLNGIYRDKAYRE